MKKNGRRYDEKRPTDDKRRCESTNDGERLKWMEKSTFCIAPDWIGVGSTQRIVYKLQLIGLP